MDDVSDDGHVMNEGSDRAHMGKVYHKDHPFELGQLIRQDNDFDVGHIQHTGKSMILAPEQRELAKEHYMVKSNLVYS